MRDCPVCGSQDESKAGLCSRDFFVCRDPCYFTYHDRMRIIREAQPSQRWPGPVESLDAATVEWFRRQRQPE